jgi:NAD+ diphosphatase
MALAEYDTVFSGNPLDRADHMREDPEILGDMTRADEARFLLLHNEEVLSDSVGEPAWLSAADCRWLDLGTTLFLGMDGDSPCYAASIAGTAESLSQGFPDFKFRDARAMAIKTGRAAPSLGIVAQAKSMLAWHRSHRFCACCGSESTMTRAGYERRCPSCNASHFPRTDPVVIMLARHGDMALVGRGPQLPPGFYSALAGFMEPGETIEEAVRRELGEEAGVNTTRVRYVASQPWPWPSSLMIGCMAWVDDTTLTVDNKELEDAMWIDRERAGIGFTGSDPSFMLPPTMAIASTLIDIWLNEQ